MGLIKSGTLTKKFFMTLPAGSYLASNLILTPARRVYEGEVSIPEKREGQWAEIRSSGAAYRLCYVYQTREDHLERNRSVLERSKESKSR